MIQHELAVKRSPKSLGYINSIYSEWQSAVADWKASPQEKEREREGFREVAGFLHVLAKEQQSTLIALWSDENLESEPDPNTTTFGFGEKQIAFATLMLKLGEPFLSHSDQLFQLFRALSSIERWKGRQKITLEFHETVADHTAEMLYIAMELHQQMPDLLSDKEWLDLYLGIMLHDFGEVLAGDIVKHSFQMSNQHIERMTKKRRHVREVAAFLILQRNGILPSDRHLMEVFLRTQAEEKKDLLSALVQWIDKYQADGIAIEHFDDLTDRETTLDQDLFHRVEETLRNFNQITFHLLKLLLKKRGRSRFIPIIANYTDHLLESYASKGYENQVSSLVRNTEG